VFLWCEIVCNSKINGNTALEKRREEYLECKIHKDLERKKHRFCKGGFKQKTVPDMEACYMVVIVN